MSDLAKLRDALRRTAADGTGGEGPVGYDDAGAGAALIVAAIDGAFLGRRLTIGFDDGTLLALEAGGRRLLRLLPPVPAKLASLAGAELRPADAETVAGVLLEACSGRHALSVEALSIPDAADPADAGIAPAMLRAALGLPVTEEPEPDLEMDGFIAALGPALVAALWIQDETVSLVSGQEEDAAALSQWAAPMLERLLSPDFPLAAALETDGIIVFVPPQGQGRHALIAGRLGAYLVAEMSGDDPAPTLRHWRAASG